MTEQRQDAFLKTKHRDATRDHNRAQADVFSACQLMYENPSQALIQIKNTATVSGASQVRLQMMGYADQFGELKNGYANHLQRMHEACNDLENAFEALHAIEEQMSEQNLEPDKTQDLVPPTKSKDRQLQR